MCSSDLQLWLPDPAVSPEAAILVQELKQLEKRKTATGHIQIAAPPGKKDDMAMALALAAYHCTMQGESGWAAPEAPNLPEEHRSKTPFEKVQKMLLARQKGHDNVWD